MEMPWITLVGTEKYHKILVEILKLRYCTGEDMDGRSELKNS